MADVALVELVIGEDDGSRTIVPVGKAIPAGKFSKEELEALREAKIVGPEPVASSEAQSEIELLKAQLAEAQERLKAQEEASSDAKVTKEPAPSDPPLKVQVVDGKK